MTRATRHDAAAVAIYARCAAAAHSRKRAGCWSRASPVTTEGNMI
jgi:hypothetical protein